MAVINRILIVDDDPISSFLLKSLTVATGLAKDIFVHNSGLSALEFLNNCDATTFPKIIILDLMMPQMDGFTFMQNFEKLYKHAETKIIVVTNSRSQKDKDNCKKFNSVYQYLNKPIDKRTIHTMITEVCEEKVPHII